MRRTVMQTGVNVSTYRGADIPVGVSAPSPQGRNYDYPIPLTGVMAKQQLARIAQSATALDAMLRESDRLPPWVQYKISTAEDRLRGAADYMIGRIKAHPEGSPYGAADNKQTTTVWDAFGGGKEFAKLAAISTLTAAAAVAAAYGVTYAYYRLRRR